MRFAVAALLVAVATPLASAQATRPAATADKPAAAPQSASLEVRAAQAFSGGKFAVALPMLQQLAGEMKDQPAQADKLGMVQEQIRVCQKNVTAAPAVAPAAAAAKVPAVAAKDDRKPHEAPKAGETRDMAIKDLGNFDYDPDQNTPIPDDVKALNGMTVRLHGYMIPLDQAENISKFALVPSLFNCCVGQPPQMQHTIIITCPKGKAVTYFPTS